jgi:hypothetical protein
MAKELIMVKIRKDGSGETWEYVIVNSDGEELMMSDGWESTELIEKELKELAENIDVFKIEDEDETE